MARPLTFKSDLDDRDFNKGLSRMERNTDKSVGRMGKLFATRLGAAAGAAGVGIGAAVAGLNKLSDAMGEINDQAASADLNVESFQRLATVLDQSGATSRDAVNGLARLTQSLVDAREEGSMAAEAFDRLGIDPSKIRDSEDALLKVADGYAASTDKAAAFAAVADLVGQKLAVKLRPALAEGAKGFRGMNDEIVVANESTVKFFDEAGDKAALFFSNMRNRIANLTADIGRYVTGIKEAKTETEKASKAPPPFIGTGPSSREIFDADQAFNERTKERALRDAEKRFQDATSGARSLSRVSSAEQRRQERADRAAERRFGDRGDAAADLKDERDRRELAFKARFEKDETKRRDAKDRLDQLNKREKQRDQTLRRAGEKARGDKEEDKVNISDEAIEKLKNAIKELVLK